MDAVRRLVITEQRWKIYIRVRYTKVKAKKTLHTIATSKTLLSYNIEAPGPPEKQQATDLRGKREFWIREYENAKRTSIGTR